MNVLGLVLLENALPLAEPFPCSLYGPEGKERPQAPDPRFVGGEQDQRQPAIARLTGELNRKKGAVIEPPALDWQLPWVPHERTPSQTCNQHLFVLLKSANAEVGGEAPSLAPASSAASLADLHLPQP